MKTVALTTPLLFAFSTLIAQTWQLLPNSPAATLVNDDIYFIGEDKGWVVNLNGFVFRTEDGGLTWDTLHVQSGTAFRCIGFLDTLHGFAGNLGPGSWLSNVTDTIPLYETFDGGDTWSPVAGITGTYPAGICGIYVVNDSLVYALGRYDGPSVFIKTTDGGLTWASTDLPGFRSLIDAYFFSPDTGLIVGGDTNNVSSIYYTTDGGAS